MTESRNSLKNLGPEEVRRLEVLSKIGKRINTPDSFSETLQAVLDAVVSSMEAERGALFLCQGGEERPVLSLWVDRSAEPTEGGFRHSGTVVETVWNEETPIAEFDTRENEVLSELASIQAEGIRSVICVPLIGRLSKLGVLYLDNTISQAFTKEDLEMLDVIADLASTALERAKLFEDLQNLNNELEQRVEERTAEAEQARTEAVRATRAKSLFLAKMSHELRTPLNGILGLSEDLARREDNPGLRLQLEQVVKSARSLSTMINGVLDYSKLETQQAVLDPHVFDLEQAIADALATVNYEACDKGLELQVWVDESCPLEVEGDSVRLKQVLINLLGNAVKFTREGWVRLLVHSPSPGQVTFSVADSGIGIPEAKQADVFQPFSQADTSTSRQFGGTGLGLSISRALCRLMGGELTLESSEGKGSRFSFQLPLKMVRAFQPPHYDGLEVGISVPSQPLSQALSKALVSWGCRVVPVESAQVLVCDQANHTVEKSAIILLPPNAKVDPNLTASRSQRYLLTPVTRGALVRALEELLDPSPSPKAAGIITGNSPSPPPDSVVLVVEDHEINRLVVQRMLETWGYRCVFAEDGSEAIALFPHHQPRIVLMDIEMPGKDGFETARELRSQETGSLPTPIIAVTAHLATDLRSRCLAAGMDDLVSKPLSRELLGSRLARWEAVLGGLLGRRQARVLDFQELDGWPAKFLTPINSCLSTLERALSQGGELSEQVERLQGLTFSAGLAGWGGRLAALPRPVPIQEFKALFESFRQEWRELAPSLVSG